MVLLAGANRKTSLKPEPHPGTSIREPERLSVGIAAQCGEPSDGLLELETGVSAAGFLEISRYATDKGANKYG